MSKDFPKYRVGLSLDQKMSSPGFTPDMLNKYDRQELAARNEMFRKIAVPLTRPETYDELKNKDVDLQNGQLQPKIRTMSLNSQTKWRLQNQNVWGGQKVPEVSGQAAQ